MDIAQIVNVLSAILLLFSGVLVFLYRQNFRMHNGIIFLFVSLGIFSLTTYIEFSFDSIIVSKFKLISQGILPIFILLFSEYVLKANYHIVLKFSVLIPTLVLPLSAFFNPIISVPEYTLSVDLFMLYTFSLVLISSLKIYFRTNKPLLKKYLLTFFILIVYSILFAANKIFKFDDSLVFSAGTFAFIGAHLIGIIISSGSTLRFFQKLKHIIFGVIFCLTISFGLFLFDPAINIESLKILFVLNIFLLSYYFFWIELRIDRKKIRSASLIADLLTINFGNNKKLLAKIRSWEQIKAISYVKSSEIEGDVKNLLLIFQQTGPIVHKHQLKILNKNSKKNYNEKGVEMLNYYFKTLDCDSVYQISYKGDFVSLSYMDGFNPALHENELNIMGKIIFYIVNSKNA
jgi:hypothetical protein